MAAAEGVEDGAKPHGSRVTDEELRRAILAALIKHDNPRVGVGRSRGRGLVSGLTNVAASLGKK